MKITQNGNLVSWIRTVLCLFGASAVFLSILFIEEKFLMWTGACVGLTIGAIGYYSVQASIFGIKLFPEKVKQTSCDSGFAESNIAIAHDEERRDGQG